VRFISVLIETIHPHECLVVGLSAEELDQNLFSVPSAPWREDHVSVLAAKSRVHDTFLLKAGEQVTRVDLRPQVAVVLALIASHDVAE